MIANVQNSTGVRCRCVLSRSLSCSVALRQPPPPPPAPSRTGSCSVMRGEGGLGRFRGSRRLAARAHHVSARGGDADHAGRSARGAAALPILRSKQSKAGRVAWKGGGGERAASAHTRTPPRAPKKAGGRARARHGIRDAMIARPRDSDQITAADAPPGTNI